MPRKNNPDNVNTTVELEKKVRNQLDKLKKNKRDPLNAVVKRLIRNRKKEKKK